MAFSNDEIYESFMEDTLVEKYASYDYKQGFTVVYRPFYKLYYNVAVPKNNYKEYRRQQISTYNKILYVMRKQGVKYLTLEARKLIVEGVRKQFL